MMWTPDDVRHALGLLPREEWLKEHERLGLPPGRRTGLTTEILLRAAADALNGRYVLVKGHSFQYTVSLQRTLQEMLRRLEPAALELVLRDDRDFLRRGGRSMATYWDHYQ